LEATSVAAGNMVSCAVRPDRTATCWGTNQYGQIGDGKGDRGAMALTPAPVKDLSDVSTIAVGGGSVCAVSTTEQLLCWGSNFTGQVPGSPQDTTLTPFAVRSVTGATVSALGSGVCLALLADGSVWGWGNGEAVQIQGAGSDSVAAPHLIPGLSL
jgi:alpha-tubulin suppressor-like RCC1 family protein